ncbi:tRNA 2-thiouridine(34) synthase MnmA [Candidatus Uhrbacteria bacterium]|nr:tRNA 2-thiouridine(34) synthase MnmA [Candidatus Uhrbacteria bacterium]
MTEPGKQKILLALSGGVDSAVAALLLLEQGYAVTGAFIKNWSDTKTIRGECAWKEERRDALRVAATLRLPFLTLDFEEAYRREVMTYFFDEYGAGRTPNPDVLCNSQIKFPLLWQEAERRGFDGIATGHHVRKRLSDRAINGLSAWKLLAGRDTEKDQSYFLHRLKQEDLAQALFPIGELTKAKVRQMARQSGLPVADKRSTRGICFVGKVSLKQFITQAVSFERGLIRTRSGEIVGSHDGLTPFTIGQRHGFGIGGGKPYYVVDKDMNSNTLVVGEKDDPALFCSELSLGDIHWISGQPPRFPFHCQARIRYRAPLIPIILNPKRSTLNARFKTSARAPAPGQFAVFYDSEECLGGGVIEALRHQGVEA